VPASWSLAPPEAWSAARLEGIDGALRRILGDDALAADEVVEAVGLVRAAVDAGRYDGRPLAAAHAALPWPDAPHLALWQGISVLREHRGDGHVACLVDAGLSGIEALVVHAATGDVPRAALQGTRGWSDEAWDEAVAALAGRGEVTPDGAFTDLGRERRAAVEARTDELAVAPWAALGPDSCDRLRTLVRPLSTRISEVMFADRR
jgi:hypothetical protein